MLFQFSSALVQGAGSGWEEAEHGSSPRVWAATPTATGMSPPGMWRAPGGTGGWGGWGGVLSWFLALSVLHTAPEGCGWCVDTETGGTRVSQLWHLAPPWQSRVLAPQPGQGPWSPFTGCSRPFLVLNGAFELRCGCASREGQPRPRSQAGGMSCRVGRDVWRVSRWGAHLPGHPGSPLPASIPPSRPPVLPGSSPRRQPRGTRAHPSASVLPNRGFKDAAPRCLGCRPGLSP